MVPATINRRASSLPMIFDCPASAHGAINVGSVNAAARGGTAVHSALALITEHKEPDLDALALRFNVERDELGVLTWYGRRAWSQLRDCFPNPESEVTVRAVFGDVAVPGHIDLRSRNGRVTNMLDWKSGRLDRNYYNQFIAYAAGEFFENPDCDEVQFAAVWLRENEVETYVFTRDQVVEWARELIDVLQRPNDFRVGPECTFCPRSSDCPALMAQVRRDVEMFSTEQPEAIFKGATADQLIAIRRRAKLVAAFAESAVELIRSHIELAGPIKGTDGTTLDLVPEKGKRVIDPVLAWPILQERLTEEEMVRCVSVSVTKAEKIVGDKAPQGGKGRAQKALGDALQLAGAVSQGTIYKLKETRPRMIKEIAK